MRQKSLADYSPALHANCYSCHPASHLIRAEVPTIEIRAISAAELPRFLALESDPARAADQGAYLERLIGVGAMRPEWCWVAVRAGTTVGRFAFWTLPSVGLPLAIVLLDVAALPESDPHLVGRPARDARAEVSTMLLARAVTEAMTTDTLELGHVIDEPTQSPQWQTAPDERAAWLTGAGFELVRTTSRWSFEGPPPPALTGRLHYRTFEDVGEGAFLDALEQVSTGSLDERIRADRDRLTPAGEARAMLDDLRSMAFLPGWWELAYGHDGALVGLVMPARPPSMTTIGYIGVVPEQRGRGYVDELLAHGTRTLRRDAPDAVIRTDTDLANEPMAAAFARAGYTRFGTRREYEYPLNEVTAPAREHDSA